jgi:hypothetical protein
MATFDRTVTLERVVTRVDISADGSVFVVGLLREESTGMNIVVYEEDITALLSPTRQAMVQDILSDAQTWLDNQPINI